MKTSEIIRFTIRNYLWNGKSINKFVKGNQIEFACCAIERAVRELKDKFPEQFPDIESRENIEKQSENIKKCINRFIDGFFTANNFVDSAVSESGFIGNPKYNSQAVNIAMQAYRKSILELIAVYFESKGD